MDGLSSYIKNGRMYALIVGMSAGVPYLFATPKVQPAELPYAIMAVVQIMLFIGGCTLAYIYNQKGWVISLFMLSGVQLLVLGRIMVDTVSDLSSHNMWPFEFVVSTILCAPVSIIGTYLGYFVRSTIKKRRSSVGPQ